MEKIKKLLNDNVSFALKNGDTVFTSGEKGVRTLFNLLTNKKPILNGSYIADRVIGKGAAFLMVLGSVKKVYAKTISEAALKVFNDYGILVEYDNLVPYIINNKKTGMCPVETLLKEVSDPNEAYKKISEFLNK